MPFIRLIKFGNFTSSLSKTARFFDESLLIKFGFIMTFLQASSAFKIFFIPKPAHFLLIFSAPKIASSFLASLPL